jgi:hypothetical protein
MVDQRNLMTHLPPEAVEAKVDNEKWLQYNFLLRVVLDLCFLKVMGFEDQQIAELAEHCNEYQARAQHLF